MSVIAKILFTTVSCLVVDRARESVPTLVQCNQPTLFILGEGGRKQ